MRQRSARPLARIEHTVLCAVGARESYRRTRRQVRPSGALRRTRRASSALSLPDVAIYGDNWGQLPIDLPGHAAGTTTIPAIKFSPVKIYCASAAG